MDFVCKQYTVCLLLLSILLQTFSTAVIYVDFYANQDFIARNLCENRDKPMLHCCGRCQLRKRLARQDNQDKSNPGKKDSETRYPLFDKAGAMIELTIPPADPLHHVPAPYNTRIIRQSADIFHPPD